MRIDGRFKAPTLSISARCKVHQKNKQTKNLTLYKWHFYHACKESIWRPKNWIIHLSWSDTVLEGHGTNTVVFLLIMNQSFNRKYKFKVNTNNLVEYIDFHCNLGHNFPMFCVIVWIFYALYYSWWKCSSEKSDEWYQGSYRQVKSYKD